MLSLPPNLAQHVTIALVEDIGSGDHIPAAVRPVRKIDDLFRTLVDSQAKLDKRPALKRS